METNYIEKIKTQFKYVSLNSEGLIRDLYKYIEDGDINGAVGLMDNNDKEVDNAIREYNPQTHPVMNRPNKPRKNMPTYITEKLPRTKQRYINEIELFFLLGKPLVWKMVEGDDEAYRVFLRYWGKFRMDSLLRKAKRLAGAETESSLVFHLSKRGDSINVKPFIAARSTGYKLRPLFDQYGDLVALAYGYCLREGKKNIKHWDILTADFTFYCAQRETGWQVETYENPTRKINSVYFKQQKAWDGVVPRLEREEKLDSKVGDTNNYFADPKAQATADVVQSISDPDIAGNLIQLTGKESRFEYINPPTNSATRQDEKMDLQKSIFFDTFTPDFSYESIKGLGTLSGAAIHNALVLGYIKCDNRKEIYGEMIDRLRSVLLEILKLIEPTYATQFDKLVLEFEFQDPFATQSDKWDGIIKLYNAGLCSLETAVKEVALADNIDEEVDRILCAAAELEAAKLEAQKTSEEMSAFEKASAQQKAEEGGAA